MPGDANPLLHLALRAMAWSARRGSILLAVGIFGGILSPRLAADFKFFVTPNVLIMTTLVLLRVDIPRIVAHLRHPARLAAITLVLMLACPVLVWAAISALPLDPGIAAGTVLVATGCAATSAPAFARMVGLDPELSLIVSLSTLVLVPFTAPPIALWLLGLDLSISTLAFTGRLVLVIGLPLLASLLLRRLLGPEKLARWGEAADGVLVWSVVFYGFAVMDGLFPRFAADPAWVLEALITGFLANYGLNLLTALAFRHWGVRPAATIGLMSGNRNMALYFAVLPAATDPRITLFFGVCQIPLFLSLFLLRPLYRGLLASAAPQADARSHR